MNFLRQEVMVPTSALSTPDGKPGLKAEYFSGSSFEGTPVVRVDKYVDIQPFHPEPSAVAPPPGHGNLLGALDGISDSG